MSSLPYVVIVGRMNVGKSTLFNRLSTDVKSMAFDYEGITRDFLKDTVCWKDVCFELIDSGGISIHRVQDELSERVRQLGFKLIEQADVVLFVVDGSVGLTNDDQQLISIVRKQNKPIVLAINKSDRKDSKEFAHEFQSLGIDDQVSISAQHGMSIAELLEMIISNLPSKISRTEEAEPAYSVVLLGKPNVGKSSLMNLLLGKERSLVFNQPGTTREAITEPVRFYQETLTLTDTAGLRRKRTIDEPVEQLMVKSSMRAVENASIVLLMVDATDHGQISDQELKLAFYCFDQGKSLIILFNKDDIMSDLFRQDLDHDLEKYDYFFKKVPSLWISCKTGKNIGKIMPLVKKVWERSTQKFDDHEVEMVLKDALRDTPHYYHSKLLIIRSAKQLKTAPLTFLLKVNEPDWFGPSQRTFLEKALRSRYDVMGAPILFVIRK